MVVPAPVLAFARAEDTHDVSHVAVDAQIGATVAAADHHAMPGW